jgi:integrase
VVKVDFPGVNTIRKKLANGTVRIYYYHRATGLRLPDDPTSPAFSAKLRDLNTDPVRTGPAPGTFSALITAYKASPEFSQLSAGTRRDYARYLDMIDAPWGRLPVAGIERKHVLALRDKFAATPRQANYVVQVIRLLLGYAVDRGWRQDNPAQRPKLLKTGDGHRPWEENEIAAFRARWPLGTRERVAFELLLNTGQRGGDVAAMVRGQYANGVIHVRQEKTKTRVWIPASRDLRDVLDPWLSDQNHIAMLPSEKSREGRPLTVDAFRHMMGDAIAAAGLKGDVTIHGLRYTAAIILTEMGCDLSVVQSITGHETVAMAKKYTAKKRAASLAVTKLDEARTARRRAAKNGSGTKSANQE